MKKNKVSIVVVHYGHGNELFRCLDSLAKINRKFKLVETILVDNNEEKTDKSKILKDYPWITYIPAPKNLGWCEGHNLGFREATGEYVFSLDSDVLIDVKSFNSIYEQISKNKKIGIVSPRVRNISGNPFFGANLELTPLRGIFYLSFIKKYFPNNPIVKHLLMTDWDRKTSSYVEAIQLGAFIIRKKAYEEIGAFDKKMFLYFHEDDISKRLREKGWKIFFDAESEAVHLESKWTLKNTEYIRQIFNRDRFHYFKKHYGIIQTLIVELFARMSKNLVILMGILVLATLLRFYRLPQNLSFTGEVGYDYMTIRTFVENHQIPLIGPRTSHEWLFLGPIFYWIFGILLPLFNYNPLAGSYFFAIVGVATIYLCYWVVKKLFSEKAGLISAFILAISPLWVKLTHDARYDSPAAVLFLPFYYFLVKSVKDGGKSLFVLGIILGCSFSFFPTPIVLLPAVITVIFIYRKHFDKKYFLPGILGFLIPNVTYLIYNGQHRFELLINIFSWVPYRILGFIGVVPKNNVTPNILQNNLTGLYTFFQQSYFHNSNILIILLSLATFIFAFTQLKKNLPLQILLILFGISYLGLFLHGDPPLHYYQEIFPIPVILLAVFLEKTSKNFLLVTIIILGYLLIWNLRFYFSDQWFYRSTTTMFADMTYVPYDLQLKVADFIVKDAGTRKFSLARVGPYDYFEENFALNYYYLLWRDGNKPVDGAKLNYTIYEDTANLPTKVEITWIENIAISKNE